MAVSSEHKLVAKGVVQTNWTNFTVSGDVGVPFSGAQFNDKVVSTRGLPGGTTQIVIEGSDIAASGPYLTLNDPQGNALEFTADKAEALLENPHYIRARLNTATTATGVHVYMTSRGDIR